MTSTDKDAVKTLKKEEDWDLFTMSVECWSIKCPHYIHYNPANFTFWALAAEMNGYKYNGTFVYKVDFTEVADSNKVRRETITFNISLALPSNATKGIVIDIAPFELWYEINRSKLTRFYAPKRVTSPSQTTEPAVNQFIEEEEIEYLIEKFGEESVDELASWTQEEVALAYEEARKRVNRKA